MWAQAIKSSGRFPTCNHRGAAQDVRAPLRRTYTIPWATKSRPPIPPSQCAGLAHHSEQSSLNTLAQEAQAHVPMGTKRANEGGQMGVPAAWRGKSGVWREGSLPPGGPGSLEELHVLTSHAASSHLLRWPWQMPSKHCCPHYLPLQAGQVPPDPKQACPSRRLKPESAKSSHPVLGKEVEIHFTGTSPSTATRETTTFVFLIKNYPSS